MSIIVKPPDFRTAFSTPERMTELFAMSTNQEFQHVIQMANNRYSHWHKFQYLSLPGGITHPEAWAYLKLGRLANRKTVPFVDKHGKSFFYWIPDVLVKALNLIDRWSGGNITTDEADPLAPKERFIIRSLMDEAIASSQLEGASTTRKAAKEMLRTGRGPKDESERMILNNWHTMQFIRKNRKAKITPQMICEIHRMITANTIDPKEAGTLRTKNDIIVEYRNETVHIPPDASDLPDRMQKMCEFANHHDESNWIHPINKGVILHFWLAYDHPFTDGNGRTARALMYLYILSQDYLLFEYLSISRCILRARGQYMRSFLFTETDDNDLTYFLNYNLQAIRLAFSGLLEYLDRKQRELAAANRLLKNYRGLNARQKGLIYHAIRHPDAAYTIVEQQNYHAIVYETARNDLIALATKGFLKKHKRGREFVFSPSEKIMEKLRLRVAQE